MQTVDALLKTATSGSSDADEALLALGLLLENRHAKRPAGDDGGLTEILGAKAASYRLSEQDGDRVIQALIGLATLPGVRPGVLWALQKSGDRRSVGAFAHVLKHTLADPNRQALAEQALEGLLLFGDESLPDIRLAAEKGSGAVQEAAQDYLDVFG